MLATKKLAGGAPEMNVRNPLHAGVEAYKWGIHSGFETTGRLHQKSKAGVSEAPQRGLMYFKNVDLKCIEVSQTPLVTAEEISKNLKFKAKSVTQKFQKGVLLTFQGPSAIRLCYLNNLILQVKNQGLFRAFASIIQVDRQSNKYFNGRRTAARSRPLVQNCSVTRASQPSH